MLNQGSQYQLKSWLELLLKSKQGSDCGKREKLLKKRKKISKDKDIWKKKNREDKMNKDKKKCIIDNWKAHMSLKILKS